MELVSRTKTFKFKNNPVREISDETGNPWFVAADICKCLKLSDHKGSYKHHLEKLDDDEKKSISRSLIQGTPTSNMGVGAQGLEKTNNVKFVWAEPEIWVISESGVYTLILRCRNAMTPGSEPHAFRRWVTHEVLPTIRKTGSYTLPQFDKKVSVRHTHLRGSLAPSGLDIRYSLDLSKHIVNPTKTTLEILERITGIQLTDIDLPFSASDDELEKLFLEYVDERCVVGDGLRISSFVLYTDFRKWLPAHSSVRIPTVKKFGGVVGRHFTRIKSSLVFFEGLYLVGEES